MRRARLLLIPLLLAGCATTTRTATGFTTPEAVASLSDSAFALVDSFVVELETTKGAIEIVVRRSWAPHGGPRVGEVVRDRYYDGARLFRAVPGFVIQWGIAADSVTTAKWRGRRLPDDTVRESNRRGTVSFAAGGPNTRTVQLFINLRDNPRLDWLGFAPVGEVISGMDAVNALYTGYGDGATAPNQGKLSNEGEAYLARDFPLLDKILSARVVRAWRAAGSPPAAP
jgi:peptidyl-prolyl cis-trans isomerase A (cyclophilin A)